MLNKFKSVLSTCKKPAFRLVFPLEAPPRFELGVKVLQTSIGGFVYLNFMPTPCILRVFRWHIHRSDAIVFDLNL